jgi:hypothetical protein
VPVPAGAAAAASGGGAARLHYIAANINVSLRSLQLPAELQLVCLQFPDPWAAAKHGKRRVASPAFAAELAAVGRGVALFSLFSFFCLFCLLCLFSLFCLFSLYFSLFSLFSLCSLCSLCSLLSLLSPVYYL